MSRWLPPGGWIGLLGIAGSLALSGCGNGPSAPPSPESSRRRGADPIAQFEPRSGPRATPVVSPRPGPEAVSSTDDSTPPQATPSEESIPSVVESDEGTSFFLVLEAPPDQSAPQPPDQATLQDLITEREALRRELRKIDQEAADIARIPLPPQPATETPGPGRRFAGTIRDLDLSSAPSADAKIVMKRRGMRLTQSLSTPGVSQDFLSGATGADGQRFSARATHREEVVNALVISPATIEHMARLERQAIQSRGLNPARTYVRRIVFGVVGSGDSADLGITLLDAVPVTNSSGPQ